jgi:hypothetical protein
MSAIESLLAGLIDYAGLYPPAGLDMSTALSNYMDYSRSRHAAALGRFLVDVNRLPELREAAGDATSNVRLSVIASASTDWDRLRGLLQDGPMMDDGLSIDSIEIRTDQPSQMERIAECTPPGLTTYFEVPFEAPVFETLARIDALGARVKLRMGGATAGAFPPVPMVAGMLKLLANRHLPFKATAGLHHPIRSWHAFSYEPDSPSGMMHGFLNLACAAALLYFKADVSQAILVLEEQNPDAWQVTPDGIAWRSFRWSTEELLAVRENFMISFGSCSFTEPMQDLEALGWL